jgi:hypothetical protein
MLCFLCFVLGGLVGIVGLVAFFCLVFWVDIERGGGDRPANQRIINLTYRELDLALNDGTAQ